MEARETELHARMTPSERDLYERWRAKIGQISISQTLQEAMADDMVIYFYGLGKEACWTWIKQWAIVNQDYNALWFDEEYAKESRWGGITAPPLYLICVHDGLECAAVEFTHEASGGPICSQRWTNTQTSLIPSRQSPSGNSSSL